MVGLCEVLQVDHRREQQEEHERIDDESSRPQVPHDDHVDIGQRLLDRFESPPDMSPYRI